MTDRKKVFIITNTLSHGGAQRVAVRLANALSVRHEVWLVFFVRDITYPVADGVRLLDLGAAMKLREARRPFKFLSYQAARLRGFLYFSRIRLREKPDATISFLHKPDLLNLSAPGSGRKILSERNNPRKKEAGYFREACNRFRRADQVVFQSETVRNMFPEAIRNKGVVIPNPVEVNCPATVPAGHRIVAAGRLHPQKNFPLLIRAFSAFAAGHPGYTLHIYGEGDDYEELRTYIDSLPVRDSVFLEGFRSDVQEAIRDAEMFVMSSDYEGMPNALLEAMMMGLPCISTAFDGIREFVGEDACLLTPVGDEAALASAMSTLSDDPLKRRELARRGAEEAKKYSLDNIIPRWEALL